MNATGKHSQRQRPAAKTASSNMSGKGDVAKSAALGIVGSIVELARTSRIALVVIIFVSLAFFGGLFDALANNGRAYSGVSVGGVDVGGMTKDQIEEAIYTEYAPRLVASGVNIYADSATPRDKDVEIDVEEMSVDQEKASKLSWQADAESLQAYIDYASVTEQALAVGRDNPSDRLSLLFGTRDIDVPLNFNEALIEALASDIDETIGKPLVNYDVEVDDGYAYIIEGEDGDMVDRDVFKDQIAQQLLSEEADNRSFVVETVHTPVQISKAAAENVLGIVQDALAEYVTFTCNNKRWVADPATVGTWIQTVVKKQDNGSYVLLPSLSMLKARSSVLKNIPPTFENGEGNVRFSKTNDDISVTVTSKGTVPLTGDALEDLNNAMFNNEASNPDSLVTKSDDGFSVTLDTAEIPDTMSLDEALSLSVVTPVSEFTTEYTSGAEERNTNIHLAADLIDNSIIQANGGVWSFNETAGECNEAKGFQAAKAISANETIDEIGGGICQVATTVFNAVYEAGYPIVERHNHSLYIASYPQGRDATVSWPNPDFRWKNDSTSDILLQLSYTDSSVTATLYGVDMGYTVETQEGEWTEGQEYTTVYEYDSSLDPGDEYVKVYGSNGHSISITRIIRDEEGNLVNEEEFTSTYKAQNTIIVRGGSSNDY